MFGTLCNLSKYASYFSKTAGFFFLSHGMHKLMIKFLQHAKITIKKGNVMQYLF